MTDLFAVETRADERAAVKLAANNKLTVACYVKRQLIGNICAIERQSLGNDRAERKLFRLFRDDRFAAGHAHAEIAEKEVVFKADALADRRFDKQLVSALFQSRKRHGMNGLVGEVAVLYDRERSRR